MNSTMDQKARIDALSNEAALRGRGCLLRLTVELSRVHATDRLERSAPMHGLGSPR